MSRTSAEAPLNAFLQSPLQAFGLRTLERGPAAADGVLACELVHLGYLILRGRGHDAAFMAGAASALGSAPPTRPTSFQRIAGGAALWLSPDEWMLVCARSTRDGLLAALDQALAGAFAQVLDASGGFTTLRLAGRDHLRVLRHLGAYDFERMQVGRCVGTVFSKAQVTVVRTDEAGVLLVFRRSFADYLWRLVERSARPYGLCVVAPQRCADPLFSPLLEVA
jgi:sarcosine oxidase subunit gamma